MQPQMQPQENFISDNTDLQNNKILFKDEDEDENVNEDEESNKKLDDKDDIIDNLF
jgi:hypothetical protein